MLKSADFNNGLFRPDDAVKTQKYKLLQKALSLFFSNHHRLDGLIDTLIYSDNFAPFFFTMGLRFPSQTGFFIIVFTFLFFLHGSRGEIPPKLSPSVTIVPPVKPDNGPQAFPDAEKANLPVFTMDYPRIQIPFEITLWMLLASFSKIGEELKLIFIIETKNSVNKRCEPAGELLGKQSSDGGKKTSP